MFCFWWLIAHNRTKSSHGSWLRPQTAPVLAPQGLFQAVLGWYCRRMGWFYLQMANWEKKINSSQDLKTHPVQLHWGKFQLQIWLLWWQRLKLFWWLVLALYSVWIPTPTSPAWAAHSKSSIPHEILCNLLLENSWFFQLNGKICNTNNACSPKDLAPAILLIWNHFSISTWLIRRWLFQSAVPPWFASLDGVNSYSTWKLLFLLLFHTCMMIFKVLMNNKSTHPHRLKGAGFLRTAGLCSRGFHLSWCLPLPPALPRHKHKAASENVEGFSILWILYIIAVSTELVQLIQFN